MDALTSKLEKMTLAKNMAESKLSDFEREKTIIELEIKEIIARHRTDVTEKMARAAQVGADWGMSRGAGMVNNVQCNHSTCAS